MILFYDLCFDNFELSSQIALPLRHGDVTKKADFRRGSPPQSYRKFKIFNIEDGIGERTRSGNLDFEMGKTKIVCFNGKINYHFCKLGTFFFQIRCT